MPKKKRFFWQLFPSYLVIAVVPLAGVTWYASSALKEVFVNRTAADLEARARLIEQQIVPLLRPLRPESIDAVCKNAGRSAATRITVLLPNGRVVGDSDQDPRAMDNHLDRTEVIQALSSGHGVSRRHSRTLQEDMLYVGVSVSGAGDVLGAVRTSVSLASLEEAVQAIRLRIAAAGLFVALLAAGLGLLVSRRVTRPLREIRRGAERFARGELDNRLPVSDSEEIGRLAETMNQMAADLRGRIDTVMRQRNEIEAMLSNMAEGVIAIDMSGRIISMNHAAGRMFECDPAKAGERSVQEVVRNIDLQRLVAEILRSRKPVMKEIAFYSGGELHFNSHGTPLLDAGGRQMGALIVLNDVTDLRRLENVRRDFVANVSHEIKTPITAIKGFVETLRDGAMENPEESKRFLGIIGKHVSRLEAIIDDLMTLSRIEQGAEAGKILLEPAPLRDLLETAVQVCEPHAASKGIELRLDCEADLVAPLDATLMEQAVVNLIHNAVTYNDGGGAVTVTALEAKGRIAIRVADQGRGIEKRHLSRVFERFYRADDGRSRHMGGTGLGLAIVKHIAQAHGGSVSVESRLGKGSLFTIHLPKI